MSVVDTFGSFNMAAANDATPKDAPGTYREYREAGSSPEDHRMYRYVRNLDRSAVNAGDVVVISTADSTVSYDIDTTTTEAVAYGAGVVVSGTITPDYYGWIQVRGLCSTVNVLGGGTSISAGDALGTSGTAGAAIKTTTACSMMAIAMASGTTTQAIAAWIKCW